MNDEAAAQDKFRVDLRLKVQGDGTAPVRPEVAQITLMSPAVDAGNAVRIL
jgi:hypothetical protein